MRPQGRRGNLPRLDHRHPQGARIARAPREPSARPRPGRKGLPLPFRAVQPGRFRSSLAGSFPAWKPHCPRGLAGLRRAPSLRRYRGQKPRTPRLRARAWRGKRKVRCRDTGPWRRAATGRRPQVPRRRPLPPESRAGPRENAPASRPPWTAAPSPLASRSRSTRPSPPPSLKVAERRPLDSRDTAAFQAGSWLPPFLSSAARGGHVRCQDVRAKARASARQAEARGPALLPCRTWMSFMGIIRAVRGLSLQPRQACHSCLSESYILFLIYKDPRRNPWESPSTPRQAAATAG